MLEKVIDNRRFEKIAAVTTLALVGLTFVAVFERRRPKVLETPKR